MKSLIVTYSYEGGAGGAAHKLHSGLNLIGSDAHVLVPTDGLMEDIPRQHEYVGLTGSLESIRRKVDRLPMRRYASRRFFAPQWVPNNIASTINKINPDVVNLHWVCNGLVAIESLKRFKRPIVWSAHDTWPFTGGCFYNYDCTRYEAGCGCCPALNSTKQNDLSYRVYQHKLRAWRDLDITLVTPSQWLADMAKRSTLFRDRRVEAVPYGIDTEIFRPIDKQVARAALGLPQDRFLVNFGAWINDERKGFHLLREAMHKLSQRDWGDKVRVGVFGFSEQKKEIAPGIPIHYVGRLRDNYSLALMYAAADVVVMPSLRETFGLVAAEAMACGTPAITFRTSGLVEVVDHKQTGYQAEPFDTDDLAYGIEWLLEDDERRMQQGINGRRKAEREFTLRRYAEQYQAIYEQSVAAYRGHVKPI